MEKVEKLWTSIYLFIFRRETPVQMAAQLAEQQVELQVVRLVELQAVPLVEQLAVPRAEPLEFLDWLAVSLVNKKI